MKRVVLVFTLFLFTLSNAFHPESLDLTTRILNHYHHDDHQQLQIKPSSDGSDSSNILTPVTSTVPDPTQSHDVELKEAVSEPEELNPVQMKNPNRVSYQVYRIKIKPIRCRKFIRFMRHPRRFGGVNGLGLDPVLNYDELRNRDVARKFPEVERAIRLFGQDWKDMGPLHDHDHDHEDDDDDDHWVEMKDHHHEDEHEDHHEMLKKKHKHRHDDHDDDEHEDHKKRKVKDILKKKRKDKDDDIHDKVKGVMKKIRKFMNFF